ncbi:helicase RepA family protein [Vibrio breoganii]|uniref:helicase RepA family protein n=1 Tax=Vibrio breoganii TaxID=553239 RepID=UPI001056B55D|nr:helicase RepA family protein [Vibrio breoganii]
MATVPPINQIRVYRKMGNYSTASPEAYQDLNVDAQLVIAKQIIESKASIDDFTIAYACACLQGCESAVGKSRLSVEIANRIEGSRDIQGIAITLAQHFKESSKEIESKINEKSSSKGFLTETLLTEIPRPNETHRKHFKLVMGSQGFDVDHDYLIKGVLPARAFGVMYGASGSLKSFHALNIASHISLGKPWDGHRVVQGDVLYIAGEGNSAVGVPSRCRALEIEYNNANKLDHLFRIEHGVAMGKIDDLSTLINTINDSGIEFKLVVIDTLARCFGDADENSTKDMGAFISACDRLKVECGVTVLVVHHTGKGNPNVARGSSALYGACDFEYRIERPDREILDTVFVDTKQKDQRQNSDRLFKAKEIGVRVDVDGDEVTSLVMADVGEDYIREEDDNSAKKTLPPREQALMNALRARTQAKHATTRTLIRDDMISQAETPSAGSSIKKNFSAYVTSLVEKCLIKVEDNSLIIIGANSAESIRNESE